MWTWTFTTIRSKAFLRSRPFSLTTVHRSWLFVWAFLNVSWTFSTVWDLFMARKAHERSETFMKESEKNRPWTFRNGERSGTLNGLKRLQNHVYGTLTFKFQKRKKQWFFSKLSLLFLEKSEILNPCVKKEIRRRTT